MVRDDREWLRFKKELRYVLTFFASPDILNRPSDTDGQQITKTYKRKGIKIDSSGMMRN